MHVCYSWVALSIEMNGMTVRIVFRCPLYSRYSLLRGSGKRGSTVVT